MATKMMFIPVSAGNLDAVKAAFAEMEGSREGQCVANRSVMGVTREFVGLHSTPNGDMLVAFLEGDDPDQAVDRMRASDSEYARWIASTVMPLLGSPELRDTAQVLADWRA